MRGISFPACALALILANAPQGGAQQRPAGTATALPGATALQPDTNLRPLPPPAAGPGAGGAFDTGRLLPPMDPLQLPMAPGAKPQIAAAGPTRDYCGNLSVVYFSLSLEKRIEMAKQMHSCVIYSLKRD